MIRTFYVYVLDGVSLVLCFRNNIECVMCFKQFSANMTRTLRNA